MKLWNYIKGSRKGKEANRIERDAMKDPFLADALEGFDLVHENHIKNIEQLRKQVRIKTTGKKPTNFRIWGVAAAILITAGAGAFFLTQDFDMGSPEKETAKVEVQPTAKRAEHEVIALKNDPPPSADTIIETPIAQSAPIPEEKEDKSSVQEKEPMVLKTEIPPVSEPDEAVEVQTMDTHDSAIPEPEPVKKVIKEEAGEGISLKEIIGTRTEDGSDANSTKEVASKKAPATKSTDKKLEPIIRGWITDINGQPLVGASVFLSGTKNVTVSDDDGYFELPSKKAQKIQVNYLGYESMTLHAELSKMTLIKLRKKNKEDEKEGKSADKSQTASVTAEKPVPAKGEAAYNKYLKDNLVRPADECKDVKGDIVIAFFVDDTGRPHKIRIVKGLCSSIDREAIRLVRKGPSWKRTDAEVTVTISF